MAHLYEEFDSLQNASEHVLPPVFPSEEHLESTFPMSDRPLYTLLKRSSSVDNIESAMNAGQDFIGQDLCDHYAFRQGKVDWQIWITVGEAPLPRKLVITSRTDEARPQSVSYMAWNLKPTFTDAIFKFTPPKGAQAIGIRPLNTK